MSKVEIFDSGEKLSEQQIEKFEAEIGEKLPADYRSFLLEHNGGYTEPDAFKIKWKNTDAEKLRNYYSGSLLSNLYILNDGKSDDDDVGDLIEIYRENADRFPRDMISIGFDAGSDPILLGIKGKNRGRVFYWSREFESDAETPEDEKVNNIGLIAESFEVFLDSLYEAE